MQCSSSAITETETTRDAECVVVLANTYTVDTMSGVREFRNLGAMDARVDVVAPDLSGRCLYKSRKGLWDPRLPF